MPTTAKHLIIDYICLNCGVRDFRALETPEILTCPKCLGKLVPEDFIRQAQAMAILPFVSLDILKGLGACTPACHWFDQEFPEGASAREVAKKLTRIGRLDWLRWLKRRFYV
jgi:DNA-directed RNA polymerase subunit RPC12/RpoP